MDPISDLAREVAGLRQDLAAKNVRDARVDGRIDRIEDDIERAREDRDQLRDEMTQRVTRVEFTPVRLLTYGAVGLILSGVVTALLALVLRG